MNRKIWKVTRDHGSRLQRTMLRVLLFALCASFVRGAYPGIDQCHGSATTSSPIVSRIILADKSHRFKIRTITAGVNLKYTSDLATVESAIEFIQIARKKFADEGYEIQTVRIANQPLTEYHNGNSIAAALAVLKK